jgi:hypothetical protein
MSPLSIIATIFFIAYATPTLGQGGATDTDLRAAYCSGVLKQEIEFYRQLLQSPPPTPEGKQFLQDLINETGRRRSRYFGYLMSKPTSVLADPAMTVATQRGRADAAQCYREVQQWCDTGACTNAHPVVCVQPNQCDDPSKLLPFPFDQ